MNTIGWLIVLLVLGLATGKIVGVLSAFTRGPAVYDLVAGGAGALAGAGLLRLLGPESYRAPLVTILTGVGAAFLATWLTRLVTWPAEPPLHRPEAAAPDASTERLKHDLITAAEA